MVLILHLMLPFSPLAGKPVNSLFVSPAVTPIKAALEPYSNNPAYRMYLYDSSDFSILVRMKNC